MKKTLLNTGKLVAAALLGGLLSVGIYRATESQTPQKSRMTVADSNEAQPQVTNYSIKNVTVPSFNFAEVAKAVRPAVVHVKTYATQDVPRSFPFDFYGEGDGMEAPVRGSGSGVIFSDDGYIVTNNHVVAEAEEIDVVLQNKRKYRAEIVGTDPNTDLAVLKIDAEEELSYIRLGNSDDVQVGEWVLAVGNPFNLTSTVTAGIVSAKARNINLLGGGSAIESFIQTDAAVNPGNSGGALVDAEGKLVGINTAIASRTGSYTGYSFAVPVNITDKVVTDIIQYGEVQRGFIGVQIRDVNAELAESKDLEVLKGVYVMGLMENGAAKEAGIQEGDVIVALNDEPVSSVPELQEKVSLMRPGDEVEVTVMRDGKKLEKTMTLKNKEGKAELQATTRSELEEMLAAEFKPVSEQTKEKLGIEHGVRVEKLEKGSKLAEVGIEENFVITYINKRPIHAKEDILKLLMGREGGVFIEGVHPDGRKDYYAFGLDS